MENHSNVTVQYEGLDLIEGVASALELDEAFCMVHVTSNPNVGGDRTVGHRICVPRSIITIADPFDTDCGEAWCSLIDPDIDNVVFECGHEAECKAAFASGRVAL